MRVIVANNTRQRDLEPMDEEKDTERRYKLDVDNTHGSSASLSALIAARKCYMHRPTGNEHSALDVTPAEHIREVRGCCADAADYLLPDTPIKDAVFRVFVARGNKPLTAQDISNDLGGRWAASAYPARPVGARDPKGTGQRSQLLHPRSAGAQGRRSAHPPPARGLSCDRRGGFETRPPRPSLSPRSICRPHRRSRPLRP